MVAHRSRERSWLAVLLQLSLLLAAGGALLPACLELREQAQSDESERCSSCHGDAERAGDFLLKSAPPSDLHGDGDVSYPGVGAHQIHLRPGATHAAFDCRECHEVPQAVDTPGHADDERPAEVIFGELSKTAGREPMYNERTRRCSDTWCHREQDPLWTNPRSSAEACGSCHGLPPALPHPQSDACALCHGDVVDAQGRIIDIELHVNGSVEHAAPACNACHGDDTSDAPPLDTRGNQSVSVVGVGAHRAHLAGGTSYRPLACAECHEVPQNVGDEQHIDGGPAEVILTSVAASYGREPSWDSSALSCAGTWCHAPGASNAASPEWTEPEDLGCADCHGAPPPLPHPQADQCERCHAEVAGPRLTIHAPLRHVDGVVDVALPEACTGCHGSENLAPPPDTRDNESSSAPGVGAHQTHVQGTERSRAVPCAECHLVPDSVTSLGHLDSGLPAELRFTGVAVAHGAQPVYSDGSCQASYCHGADVPGRHESGGSQTEPVWTRVDGSQTACGSCHGLPPPLPHPPVASCADCHRNMLPDHRSFRAPELHVNGIAETLIEE